MHFFYKAYRLYAEHFLESPVIKEAIYQAANSFRPTPFGIGNIAMFDKIHFMAFFQDGHWSLWLKLTPISWFMERFVINTPANEMFWQYAIVVFCGLLACAFFGGLFTSLASIGAMCAMLVWMLTVGLPYDNWWVVFAAFACIFTGSRTLSLDYYVMPKLKAWWKNRSFVKKWYLYID